MSSLRAPAAGKEARTGAQNGAGGKPLISPLGGGRQRGRYSVPASIVLLSCVALAALSLLLPHTPTYDPWAWIIWGREIAGLDLNTHSGPSWKPFPVLFTTVFSIFGDAAPALWLLVARAGGLFAVAMAFRLANRLAGGAAGIVAGLVAAGAVLSSSGYVRTVALGNSEGVLVACVLWAIERHLDGRRDHAFLLAFAAALIRPEVWPFVGLYALFVFVTEPRRRIVVALLMLLLPVLWFGPELWGSGDLLRASARANTPNPDSPAFDEHPALEVFKRARITLIAPIKAGVIVAVAFALVAFVRRRAEKATLAIALGGASLVVVVAIMTEAGYSGNFRYLVLPAALGSVLGGVGAARVLQGIAALAERLSGSARVGAGVAVAAAAVLGAAALPFALPRARHLPRQIERLEFQAQLADDLDRVIELAGGPERVVACGQPFTNRFLVPAVAWRLDLHGIRVGLNPRPPAVVFRARETEREPPQPALPPGGGPFRRVAAAGEWEVFAACRRGRSVGRPANRGAPVADGGSVAALVSRP